MRKDGMHAGRCDLRLLRVELVVDLAVLLRDRVEPLHLDGSKCLARLRMRYFPAHQEIVSGVGHRNKHDRDDDGAQHDERYARCRNQAFILSPERQALAGNATPALQPVRSAPCRGRHIAQQFFRSFDRRITPPLQIAQRKGNGFVGENSGAFQLAPLRRKPQHFAHL